jgi:hypothetical protein
VAQLLTIKESAFKARFVSKNVTLDKEEANTTNQKASNIRNSQKRQRTNTSFATDRQKVKRARYKTYDKPHNISRCWLAVKAIRLPG